MISKVTSAQQLRPLMDTSDWEIIQSINDVDAVKAEMAFNEFYARYKSHLLKVCRKCCKGFDSSDLLADDIFQNTFIKVLHKAHTFHPSSEDSSEIAYEIKAWLSKIARNELIEFLRRNPDEKYLSNPLRPKSDKLELETFSEEPEIVSNSKKLISQSILDKALNSLSEREKYILMTYMQFYDPHEPNKHIPDEILKGLCEKFGVNAENVRKIKSRALLKIKQGMSVPN